MTTLVATPGAADANSYTDRAEADEYLLNDRLHASAWDTLDDSAKDAALMWATRELERLDYVGYRVTETQALKWPRSEAYLDGRLLANDEVPKQMKDATAEMAFWLSQGDRSAPSSGEQFQELGVGPITLKFRDPAGRGGILDAMPDTVRGLIGGLTTSGTGTGINHGVLRR